MNTKQTPKFLPKFSIIYEKNLKKIENEMKLVINYFVNSRVTLSFIYNGSVDVSKLLNL